MSERDRARVWHPYAPPQCAPLFEITSASGTELELTDGRKLIDGMSSWWAAIHGYRHPRIEAALQQQLETLPHVMFGGLTHAPAVALCERLVDLAPAHFERVFLSDSGSVAVEIAIKMAFQFWLAQGEKGRNRLLTIRGGYHGDTFATMAVCDPINGMHELFSGMLPSHVFAERPVCRFGEPCEDAHFQDIQEKLWGNRSEIAAVILEPIAQGAGGMWFYSADYLNRLRGLCDEAGVLLIFDEIATGFGRTGKMLAGEHAGIASDILCLGKALTGGNLTLAATLASDRVCETIGGAEPGSLMHGPTFMGNPLACAAALANLDLLAEGTWVNQVSTIQSQLEQGLAPCRSLEGVEDVRVLGAMGVVELKTPVDMALVQPAFVERGVWIRPFGRLVYTMPPYISNAREVEPISSASYGVIEQVHNP